jgi:hypothetical protein
MERFGLGRLTLPSLGWCGALPWWAVGSAQPLIFRRRRFVWRLAFAGCAELRGVCWRLLSAWLA